MLCGWQTIWTRLVWESDLCSFGTKRVWLLVRNNQAISVWAGWIPAEAERPQDTLVYIIRIEKINFRGIVRQKTSMAAEGIFNKYFCWFLNHSLECDSYQLCSRSQLVRQNSNGVDVATLYFLLQSVANKLFWTIRIYFWKSI